MKILNQLWKAFKGADASPLHIVQQTKWDPTRKLYIVGDLSTPDGPPDPTNPANRTIDDGDIPFNWHQCFYYHEVLNVPDQPTHGYHYVRCRNLAGPGLKPSFCIVHAIQEAQLHKENEARKAAARANSQSLVEQNSHYCKYGPCVVTVWGDRPYCSEHEAMLNTDKKVINLPVSNPFLEEEECGCYGYCEKHFNNGQPRTQEQIEWDAITEEVDWQYCQRIGWGHLSYRQNRKTIPMQAQETVHFKLELRGSRDEIDLFHAILNLCDSDYPLDPFRKNTAIPPKCTNCGGYVWKNAIVTPVDIKKAARQAGINVKVRTYLPESTCKKKDRAANA
jgi:hypothetical protein